MTEIGADAIHLLRRGVRNVETRGLVVKVQVVDQVRGHADVMKNLLVFWPQMKGVPEARRVAALIAVHVPVLVTRINLPGAVDDETLQQLKRSLSSGNELEA